MLHPRALAVALAALFLAGAVPAQENPSPAAPSDPANLALAEARSLSIPVEYGLTVNFAVEP